MTRFSGVSPDRMQPRRIVTVVVSFDRALGPVSPHHAAGKTMSGLRDQRSVVTVNLFTHCGMGIDTESRDDVVADLWIEVRSSLWERAAWRRVFRLKTR
jgi:hypothetical protein